MIILRWFFLSIIFISFNIIVHMIVAGHYIPLNPIQIDESYLKYLLEIVPSKITSFKIYLKLDLLLMIGVSFYLATISYTIYTNFQTIRNDNRIIKKK